MLEKEKLDAVFVETTTHARVLACIHVLQAGCDVYAEKPHVARPWPRAAYLARAVQKYNRVLQTGSQQRSMPINQYASKLVREGAIGKVHTVITFNFLPGMGWTPRAPEPIPERARLGRSGATRPSSAPTITTSSSAGRNYIDYDTGGQSWGVTGWGTHSLDQVQCALGTDATGPVEIWPEEEGLSARVTARYANGTLLKLEGKKRGHGRPGGDLRRRPRQDRDQARQLHRRPGQTCSRARLRRPSRAGASRWPTSRTSSTASDSRKRPNADVETGHRATTLCHLVNICRIMGRSSTGTRRARSSPATTRPTCCSRVPAARGTNCHGSARSPRHWPRTVRPWFRLGEASQPRA